MPAAFDSEAIRAFEHARWEAAATVYGATFAKATAPFIAPLLDAAGVKRDTQVLDIACGPGFVASAAVDRGAVASGVDFSPAMLAVARAREGRIRFEVGDAEVLPFADGVFDAVVANFGIHHVPQPARALREAFRVLRPGGRVAFSFWADPADNIAWKLVFDAVARHGDRAAARTPAPGGGFGTAEQCAEALRTAGFTDCATRTVRAVWRLPDAAALVESLRAGTARMAAMLEAQARPVLAAVVADIAGNAEAYREGLEIAVPVAAVVASGVRA